VCVSACVCVCGALKCVSVWFVMCLFSACEWFV